MTARARSRKAPLPVPLANSGGLADSILRAVIETADHIATIPTGGTYGWSRSHFLLVELSEQMFRQLVEHGAASEDDEPDDDNEEDERRLRLA